MVDDPTALLRAAALFVAVAAAAALWAFASRVRRDQKANPVRRLLKDLDREERLRKQSQSQTETLQAENEVLKAELRLHREGEEGRAER